MTIYTEQVNEHPVGCIHRELASHVTTNSFWCLTDLLYITRALERKLKSSPLLRSTCKTFFQFLGIRAEATAL